MSAGEFQLGGLALDLSLALLRGQPRLNLVQILSTFGGESGQFRDSTEHGIIRRLVQRLAGSVPQHLGEVVKECERGTDLWVKGYELTMSRLVFPSARRRAHQ